MTHDHLEALRGYLETVSAHPVFLAHNANVDALVRVDESLADVLAEPTEGERPATLESPAGLARFLTDAMAHGEGDLHGMDPEFGEWLETTLEADEMQLGGQAAIMADLLAVMGGSPLLYTYLLTETQRSMFTDPAAIDFPAVEGDALEVVPVTEVTNAERTKINWIFEFEAGQRLFDTVAAASTRFIAASRPERINLDTGLEPVAADVVEEFECALLSGYHSLKAEYEDGTTYADHVQTGREFLRELKRHRDVPIQIEYGVTHKEGLRRALAHEIVPEVDAIGLDSRELDLLAADLGVGDDAGDDVVATYRRLERVRESLGIDCVKLHRTHYFVSATSGEYLDSAAMTAGWDFASIVAASRASLGGIHTPADLEVGLETPYSSDGTEAVERLADHLDVAPDGPALTAETVVAHANRVVPNPVGTVGLGDSVAVANFALEQAAAADDAVADGPLESTRC